MQAPAKRRKLDKASKGGPDESAAHDRCTTTKIKGRKSDVPGKSFTLKVEMLRDDSWCEAKPRASTCNFMPSYKVKSPDIYMMDYHIGRHQFVYVTNDINTTLRLTEHDIGISDARHAESFAETLRARFGPLVKVQLQMHLDYDEYDGVSEYSDYEEEDDE